MWIQRFFVFDAGWLFWVVYGFRSVVVVVAVVVVVVLLLLIIHFSVFRSATPSLTKLDVAQQAAITNCLRSRLLRCFVSFEV